MTKNIRIGLAIGTFLGFMTGCTAHAPAPETETVGALAAGPSVYSAPVHETTAPPTVELAGSADDDDVSSTVTTTVRADAGSDVEAPEAVAKQAHGF